MEVLYYVASSVDGYIATPDGGVAWLDAFQGGGEDYGFKTMYASVDVLLMGSGTYEKSLEFPTWPSPDRPSRVFTRRELPIAHESVTLTSEEPAAVVAALGAEGFERAWLLGGGKLASSFRAAGLITHHVISVIPVVLGGGIPLFAEGPAAETLRLLDTKAFANGIVQLSYERERLPRDDS